MTGLPTNVTVYGAGVPPKTRKMAVSLLPGTAPPIHLFGSAKLPLENEFQNRSKARACGEQHPAAAATEAANKCKRALRRITVLPPGEMRPLMRVTAAPRRFKRNVEKSRRRPERALPYSLQGNDRGVEVEGFARAGRIVAGGVGIVGPDGDELAVREC